MKLTRFTTLIAVGLLITAAVTGCKKKSGFVTPLPAGGMAGKAQDPRTAGPAVALNNGDARSTGLATGLTGDEINNRDGITQAFGGHLDWAEDRDMFRANIVHFAFDSSAVRADDQVNVTAVADYLKANPAKAVKVEGHCDERGTEEYNRALGDRRAIAIREELIRMGIDPTRVDTITYGEDRPIAEGAGEAVWSQNRRGEFVVLTAPQ